ncbi:MAG: tetratricopeptide repeat protein [Bacteroidales bacterium]
MRITVKHIIILLISVVTVSACSTKKNTKMSRFYQGMTARFNVYFNGNESFKESLGSMQNDYQDDFTRIVHLHPVSAYGNEKETKPGGDFTRAIEKSKKAIQLHSIKKKPQRNPKKMGDPKYKAFVNREEFNPYIHNAWILMGKAQFFKGEFLEASATFAYIARHFKWKEDFVKEARIWLMRCYIEMGWFYETEEVMHKLGLDSIPPTLRGDLSMAYADYNIRKGSYKDAIPYLKNSIASQKNKHQKLRQTFTLAQLYALTGDKQSAYVTYGHILKMSPPYRTEFNARIKQTEVMTGGDINKALKSLNKMTKSARNAEYLDQIYYAMGNIYIMHNDTVKALECYLKANEKSTRDGIDKAINQITLGNLYFAQRKYAKAQPCYAEGIPLLDSSYPDYDILVKRSAVLDGLSIYAQNVELQDSLQHVASLPEEEVMKLINKKIEEVKETERLLQEEKDRAEYLERQESMSSNFGSGFGDAIKKPTEAAKPMGGGSTSWYFYNRNAVATGKADFQRRWGKRKLEDNWRRRDKAAFSMSDFNEYNYAADDEKALLEDSLSQASEGVKDTIGAPVTDTKDPRYYLQQLPRSEEEISLSNELIMDGLFNMGVILKNDLEDFDAAMGCFDRLDRSFPENQYRLESYYNIYLMYMMQGDRVGAEVYRQKILTLFPESRYALAMADPNYLENMRKMELEQDSLYRAAYESFLGGNNSDVHARFKSFSDKYPLSKYMPKIMLVNALAYVNEGDIDNFKTALHILLERYPQEDVSPLATGMLKGVAQGRKVISGMGKHDIWTTRFGATAEDGTAEGEEQKELLPFVWDKDVPYVMLMVFSTDSVDSNQILFLAAKYNFTNFFIKDFDLEITTFEGVGMLVVKGFNNLKELTLYRRKIEGERGMNLPEGVRTVMISQDNYTLLLQGHTLQEYFDFWEHNFGGGTTEQEKQ